jgi:translocation protein SEC62
MLPLSMLALRVEKVDPNAGHEGHNHAPKKEKRVKGLWTVKVAQRQDFEPMMHYAWIYEESSWKTKIYAGLAVIAAFTVVMFPLWPLFMRQGVWYLSMGMLGLLGLFFAMAIVRLILFCLTVFTVPPGFWLFPNLFEDVGFFESFVPLYGWGDNKKPKKKKAKQAAIGTAEGARAMAELAQGGVNGVAPAAASTTGSDAPTANVGLTRRHEAPRVEEVGDDED